MSQAATEIETPTPQVLEGLTYEQYAALPGVQQSTLKLMDSPARARWMLDHPDDGDTAARGMLRAIHALALEGEHFERDFAVCDMRRDARTKVYQEFLAKHEGKTILSLAEHAQASAIASAAMQSPTVGPVLMSETRRCELTITWTDMGVLCKGRIDHLDYDGDFLVVSDMKTVPSVDAGEVGRMAVRLGWLLQAAHYTAGVRATHPGRPVRYQLLCVESAKPHDTAVLQLDDCAVEAGEFWRRRYLPRYAECVATGVWPGRYEAPVWLDVPDYALQELDMEAVA